MRAFRFINTTGGTIPAGAAMTPTGKNTDGLTTVAQPTADSSMRVIFNAPVDVANNGVGIAFGWDGGVVPVAVNPADEPYTASDTFGTANGDWKLRKGKKGFRLPTPSIQGVANAVPDPAGAVTALLTQNNGGSQALTPTGEIRLMPATGIRTDVVSGRAEFSLIGASDTQMGAVTLLNQTFAGAKRFLPGAGETASTVRLVIAGSDIPWQANQTSPVGGMQFYPRFQNRATVLSGLLNLSAAAGGVITLYPSTAAGGVTDPAGRGPVVQTYFATVDPESAGPFDMLTPTGADIRSVLATQDTFGCVRRQTFGGPGDYEILTGKDASVAGLQFYAGLYHGGTLAVPAGSVTGLAAVATTGDYADLTGTKPPATTTVSLSYNPGTKDLTVTVNGVSDTVNLT